MTTTQITTIYLYDEKNNCKELYIVSKKIAFKILENIESWLTGYSPTEHTIVIVDNNTGEILKTK